MVKEGRQNNKIYICYTQVITRRMAILVTKIITYNYGFYYMILMSNCLTDQMLTNIIYYK